MSIRALVATACFIGLLPDARWSEGFTDIVKEAADESSANGKTRTILFLAGIRF